MKQIAILDDYQRQALSSADWNSLAEACAVTVFDRHLGGEDEVAAALEPFHIVVCMRERTPFPASLLARLANLELLVTTGLRNLAIDMEAAKRHDVTVCGTAMTSHAAFEHTWALILALAKNIPAEDRLMHAGGWQAGPGIGLEGKTLGVLGLGKLGSQSAALGNAFGMRVVAHSANLSDDRAVECSAERLGLDDLLAQSDIVTVHLVLSDRTRALIGARELGLMKPSACLVNTSRGPIVDERALIEALRRKSIRGAGIDVYAVEPLPAEHDLRKLDNAVLTGHTGYVIEEMYALAYGQAIEDIQAWLADEPLRLLN
ncbi:MAG: D-2-hydroxyacid dehydrogenase family protein [Gammaproteobacteria bacterium]